MMRSRTRASIPTLCRSSPACGAGEGGGRSERVAESDIGCSRRAEASSVALRRDEGPLGLELGADRAGAAAIGLGEALRIVAQEVGLSSGEREQALLGRRLRLDAA